MANQNVTVYVSNLPIGAIILWNGTPDGVPDNWAICDGNNDTPNLTDKFILGAGGDFSSSGGNSEISLDVSQLPSHYHSINLNTNSTGNHSHFFSNLAIDAIVQLHP